MHPLRFLIPFVACYFALEAIYFLLPDNVLRDVVYKYGIVSVSAEIVHLLAPHETIIVDANRLLSASFSLEVVRGCDGAGAAFLTMAAMLVYPAPWRQRLAGSLAAVALVWGMNQARIVGLFFIGAYHSSWFAPIHSYVAPTLMIALAASFFAAWLAWVRPLHREPL